MRVSYWFSLTEPASQTEGASQRRDTEFGSIIIIRSKWETGSLVLFFVFISLSSNIFRRSNISAPIKGIPTNNNAEIQAATQAILKASAIGKSQSNSRSIIFGPVGCWKPHSHFVGVRKIKLHTDSQFLINCMTQWIHKWKKNNWTTVNKQPVKNKESLMELDGVIPLMDEVVWVFNDQSIESNSMSDVRMFQSRNNSWLTGIRRRACRHSRERRSWRVGEKRGHPVQRQKTCIRRKRLNINVNKLVAHFFQLRSS